MAETWAVTTQKDVYQVYFSLPARDRQRMRWVMSQQTLTDLTAEIGVGTPYRPPGVDADITLLFRPIRVDDATEGLSYELVDD